MGKVNVSFDRALFPQAEKPAGVDRSGVVFSDVCAIQCVVQPDEDDASLFFMPYCQFCADDYHCLLFSKAFLS